MFEEKFFTLRNLKISHRNSSMPIGTDALLLGSWADFSSGQKLLEIGSGCGVISLILAERSEGDINIDTIDIDPGSVEETRHNILLNKKSDIINAALCSLQQWKEEKYDLIISNPPFFNNGQGAADDFRKNARHQHYLSSNELFQHSEKRLTEHGSLQIIYPYEQTELLIDTAAQHQLFPFRKTIFRSVEGKVPRRILLHFKKDIHASVLENEVIHFQEDGRLHSSYKLLLANIKDFNESGLCS